MSQCPVNSKDVNDMAFTPFYEWFFIKQGGSIQIGEPELPAVNSSLREVAETISNRQYGVCTDVVTGLMKSISLISRHIRRMGLADGTNIASPVISKMSALQKAKSLMEHGFQDAGCVVDVARSVGMSESHFIRAFKHAFGATPKKFSLDVQMRRAAALLVETDIKVKNASDFLGYTDPSSFSRAFTRFHGISPTEFQQTMLIKRQAGM
jgi:AraC family transcriptional regulator